MIARNCKALISELEGEEGEEGGEAATFMFVCVVGFEVLPGDVDGLRSKALFIH